MSTVARKSLLADSGTSFHLTGRNEHRYSGILLAIGASAGLWGLIGASAWGVSSLLG